MNRRVATLGLTVAVTGFLLAWCVPIDRAAEEKAAAAEGFTPKKLITHLNKRIEIGIDGGHAPRRQRRGAGDPRGEDRAPIFLDEKAFKMIDPAFNVKDSPVELAGCQGRPRLDRLLLLLGEIRMENGYGVIFLVRGRQSSNT